RRSGPGDRYRRRGAWSSTPRKRDRLVGLSEHAEQLFELRADRQVERLACRQPAHEPLVVELGQTPLARDALEGALDQRGELRVVTPQREAVGIVGEKLADHLHAGGLRVRGDEAV